MARYCVGVGRESFKLPFRGSIPLRVTNRPLGLHSGIFYFNRQYKYGKPTYPVKCYGSMTVSKAVGVGSIPTLDAYVWFSPRLSVKQLSLIQQGWLTKGFDSLTAHFWYVSLLVQTLACRARLDGSVTHTYRWFVFSEYSSGSRAGGLGPSGRDSIIPYSD